MEWFLLNAKLMWWFGKSPPRCWIATMCVIGMAFHTIDKVDSPIGKLFIACVFLLFIVRYFWVIWHNVTDDSTNPASEMDEALDGVESLHEVSAASDS